MSRGPIPDKPADRPTVPEVSALLRDYYKRPGNGLGGAFHCFTEDQNTEEYFAWSSLESCLISRDELGSQIARMLIECTPTQRRKISRQSFYDAE